MLTSLHTSAIVIRIMLLFPCKLFHSGELKQIHFCSFSLQFYALNLWIGEKTSTKSTSMSPQKHYHFYFKISIQYQNIVIYWLGEEMSKTSVHNFQPQSPLYLCYISDLHHYSFSQFILHFHHKHMYVKKCQIYATFTFHKN